MAKQFRMLTGIAILALVVAASPAVAQTDERDHAVGQADDFPAQGQRGAKENAGKITMTTGERIHAGGQADDFTTHGQQGAKDEVAKANKQGSKNKNNGKAGNSGGNGVGTDEIAGTGGATSK